MELGNWLEWWSAGEKVIGLLIAVFSSLFAAFVWWDKRSRKYADSQVSVVEKSNLAVTDRLKAVEDDLQRIDRDVTQVRKQIAGLPTAQQFMDLKVDVAAINATMTQLNGMTQTLYRAAMRASEDK